jgi:ADP-dependent NAD(P)H-hydrate dehydratase / NAD(P)H-hydrate epimerase
MFAVVGTVPKKNFPLVAGKATLENGEICIGGNRVPIKRGTSALLAAAIKAGEALGIEEPFCYLAGDIGRGDGSEKLYRYLVEDLKGTDFHTIVFHYLQPHIGWHSRILSAVRKLGKKPILIADAGFMYVAKMSGRSDAYDLFTPDIGELAFLADELAPHPFYTRGFLLHEDNHVPDLISRAYVHGNAARYLLVKGRKDYIASKEGVQAVIEEYSSEAMEAIGGTGDTLTGIVSAFIASGMEIGKGAILAARVNRLAGYYAQPSPGTQVNEIIQYISKASTLIRIDPLVLKKSDPASPRLRGSKPLASQIENA